MHRAPAKVAAPRGPNGNRLDMTHSETVTVFNDLVVFAPGALVDAPVHCSGPLGGRHRADPRRHLRDGRRDDHRRPVLDADDQLIDFVSDDPSRASRDDTTFTRRRWNTPLYAYREIRGAGRPGAPRAGRD